MSICNIDHFAESYWEHKQFVLVGGAFDPLHEGHLEYFLQARRLGPLVCAISPDAELQQKRTPLLPELTRLKVLNACGLVEHVHLAVMGIPALIRALKPSHYVVGVDWQGKIPTESLAACKSVGADVVFVEARENASTALLSDYERRRATEKLAALETFVATQKPPVPWEPVTDYSREARMALERPHAQFIKDTFKPSVVLDAGCGHGYLADALRQIFVCVRRMDAVYRGQQHNWTKGDLTAETVWDVSDAIEPRSADLVICREVLEHLTVPQVARAVRNLIGLSSRYVYVTTRFTAKAHPFEADGRDDLDPTHITMLNQDLLRLLFVVEGCRRRADLEARMDWRKLGRVLVYEVPHD